jgi:hypothetical protein
VTKLRLFVGAKWLEPRQGWSRAINNITRTREIDDVEKGIMSAFLVNLYPAEQNIPQGTCSDLEIRVAQTSARVLRALEEMTLTMTSLIRDRIRQYEYASRKSGSFFNGYPDDPINGYL